MMVLDYLLPMSPGIQFLHPQCSPGTLDDTIQTFILTTCGGRSISLPVWGLFIGVSTASMGPGAQWVKSKGDSGWEHGTTSVSGRWEDWEIGTTDGWNEKLVAAGSSKTFLTGVRGQGTAPVFLEMGWSLLSTFLRTPSCHQSISVQPRSSGHAQVQLEEPLCTLQFPTLQHFNSTLCLHCE